VLSVVIDDTTDKTLRLQHGEGHKTPSAAHGGKERISGVRMKDRMTGEEWDVKCKVSRVLLSFSQLWNLLVVELSDTVREGASGVDDTLKATRCQ
jgi:hypothetical protein